MSCWKCAKFDWDDPQEVIYTDPKNGKGLCLFHAPSEQKKVSHEEFNRKVYERISTASGHFFCDLSGTIFPHDILISQNREILTMDLTAAEFEGEVSFTFVTFSGAQTQFSHARFAKGVRFLGVKFKSPTYFHETHFKDKAFWDRCHFYEGVEFKASQFDCLTRFVNTSFSKQALFSSIAPTQATVMIFVSCPTSPNAITFLKSDPTCLDITQQYGLANFYFIDSPWEKNGRIKACTEDEEGMLQPTRDFYQRMKAKYKAENNEYEASKWHIAEKEAQLKLLRQETQPLRAAGRELLSGLRDVAKAPLDLLEPEKRTRVLEVLAKAANSCFERLTYHTFGLYKLMSGFGEKPYQAFAWLFVWLMLPMLFPGNTVDYIPLATVGTPSENWTITRLFMVFWQGVIYAQVALFGFALRNIFRR
jgi:hypothetical protein